MVVRNKKTGEIRELKYWQNLLNECGSIAELNAEWEDYEEPKYFWFIDPEILIAWESTDPLLCDKKVAIETMKRIGNYFETREEAEKAVEKLKAVKRLKDAGCRVTEYKSYGGTTSKGEFIGEVKIILDVPNVINKELLCLLFGGEDE